MPTEMVERIVRLVSATLNELIALEGDAERDDDLATSGSNLTLGARV